MIGYIYKITNIESGKFYIGKRQKPYFDKDYWGSSRQLLIDIAIKGKESFTREVIDTADSIDELVIKEIYHIKNSDAINKGYNKSKGGEGYMVKKDNVVKEVYSTSDYSKFKTIVGNREVDDGHVSRIVREFEEVGQLNPIIVNSDFEVVDGQHRLEACKKSKRNVEYIIVDNDSLKAVLSINNVNKKWNVMDYISNHATLGNEDYSYLKNHFEEHDGTMYHIPITVLMKFMSGDLSINNSTSYSISTVQKGHFTIYNKEGFEELFSMYQLIIDALKFDKALPRELSIPIMAIVSHKNFDLLRFINKIKGKGNTKVFLDNWRNTDKGSIFREIVALYNKGLQLDSKNRIEFTTEEIVEYGERRLSWKPIEQNMSSKYYKM